MTGYYVIIAGPVPGRELDRRLVPVGVAGSEQAAQEIAAEARREGRMVQIWWAPKADTYVVVKAVMPR